MPSNEKRVKDLLNNTSSKMSAGLNLVCELNAPPALKSRTGKDGEEMAHGLPPYKRRPAFIVDDWTTCPSNWMRSSDDASSYFVPVEEDSGMWLDFNQCFKHDHDVAIVLSIQGVNPITGMKQEAPEMQQYNKCCPVHEIDFQKDRYCPECEFNWPKQNYLTTTTTPDGRLWLDGFRAPDGKVHQYIFTAETLRGIAAQIIGDERVYSIGVAFFTSLEPKPKPPQYTYRHPAKKVVNPFWNDNTGSPNNPFDLPSPYEVGTPYFDFTKITCSLDSTNRGIKSFDKPSNEVNVGDITRSISLQNFKPEVETKKLEVGAGAVISQNVYEDNKSLSYWRSKSSSMLYINYVTVEDATKILASGLRPEKEKGFMQNLNVGN